MEFGIFLLQQQRGYHQAPDRIMRNAVEQTVAAEQAGFNTAWYAEHHFNNYSLSPSPLMMIAHCAALTKTIRLGSAICVLPLYHPLRFLAEAGFADTMSNGRLELGVGSGYQEFEFERFGVKLADAPAIFNEFLDILQLGFRERVFSYEGKHLNIIPSAISVRTTQQPAPPIWMASAHPETMKRCIREGHNVFVTAFLNGNDGVQNLRDRLVASAEAVGADIANTKMGLLRCAYASDNDAEITAYLDNARFQRRISESLKFRRVQSDDGYLVKEVESPTDMPLETMRSNLPVGSVNRVIDKLLEEISILKPQHIAIQTQFGDFDHATMLRQLDLWGERIIPAVRKALGSDAKQAAAAE